MTTQTKCLECTTGTMAGKVEGYLSNGERCDSCEKYLSDDIGKNFRSINFITGKTKDNDVFYESESFLLQENRESLWTIYHKPSMKVSKSDYDFRLMFECFIEKISK